MRRPTRRSVVGSDLRSGRRPTHVLLAAQRGSNRHELCCVGAKKTGL